MNRSPTIAVKDKTLEEAWSYLNSLVKHFKVFGCIGYVHNHDQKRKKWMKKALNVCTQAYVVGQKPIKL